MVELVSEHGAYELRTSFKRGRWDSHSWGLPLVEPSSSGVEVRAVLKDGAMSKE